ncbi:hypothetical protein BGM19_01415 [Streptomyces agglomeratus]|nr:hypothetical protein BGK70_01395 [Streptomyces agglomeratus]OEJ56888.1 hypothetical protein BGM19_01415 [Streptomyces agglomeratus]
MRATYRRVVAVALVGRLGEGVLDMAQPLGGEFQGLRIGPGLPLRATRRTGRINASRARTGRC